MSEETNATVEPSADLPEAPEALLEAARAEAAGLKDQLLRTLAEMENLRRRTEREITDARSYAVTAFARDVLSVADNLSRALSAVPAGAEGEGLAGLVEGVGMTERELIKTLERHGVQKVDPVGEKFDPNFHQAMFEVPVDEASGGTVVQVVQAGFRIRDRVLRPALVGVGRAARPAPRGEEQPAGVDRTV